MEYFYSKTINIGHDEARTSVIEALKSEGFGIVSEIDMQSKFKEKLGVEYKKYTILGACNPAFAYKAVQAEEKIGVMLPCNIVLIEKENGHTEVAAINPTVSMMAVNNALLKPLAGEVTERLKQVLSGL